MNGQVTLTGMVLKVAPVGEYDKRLVILTKERGKITVFAKGARRQNSPYMACSQPFVFGKFRLYEGRTSYNLAGVEVSNYFIEIRDDLEKVSYGMYMLEFADYYTRENADEKNVLILLYQSCRALNIEAIPNKLVKAVFELKMIALNGEISDLRNCVNCGNEEELTGVSVLEGQAVCNSCKGITKDVIPLSSSAIYTMQFIVYAPMDKLYSFTVTDEVLSELIYFMSAYVFKCVDKEFASLEMLKIFENIS